MREDHPSPHGGPSVRLTLRLLAILLLTTVVLVVILLVAAAAIVGLPLLWEALIRAYTAPPKEADTPY